MDWLEKRLFDIAFLAMQDCFDEGGYETESTLYTAGTAERMIEAPLDLINTLI